MPVSKNGRPLLPEHSSVKVTSWRDAFIYRLRQENVKELKKFLHGLWVIYDVRGWYPAGLRLFEQASAVLERIETTEAQSALGWLLPVQGMFKTSTGLASRTGFELVVKGVRLLEQLGETDSMVIPLISLFVTARRVGEREVSVMAANDCLKIATGTNNQWGIIKAKQLLALRAIEDGDYDTAEQLAAEALEVCASRGDRWSESIICIEVVGTIEILRKRYELAENG